MTVNVHTHGGVSMIVHGFLVFTFMLFEVIFISLFVAD